MMALSSVVLPAPFGPMTVTIWPGETQAHVLDGGNAVIGDGEAVDFEHQAPR